ncbi:MAG TPA: serpin family protein [Pyrinomonadaceae bacterium]|nr:serpin family protein [Pyrinomonadaceae bacterium]
MPTLTSGLLTKARSITVLLAALLGLIVSSNIVVTSKVSSNTLSNSRFMMQQQPLKKVDDRLIAATSRFSFKLYNQLLKQGTSKNRFVSPSSVLLALAMTYNGAEGETRQAMARALELEGLSPEEVNRGFADLKSMLGSADPKLQLNIANSLWARKGFALKPDFIQRTKEFYAAEVTSLDFSNPGAPGTINSWVKNNTGGRIDKIVDKISDDTILFLINAIYFKGQWTVEFEKSKTREDDFKLADGSQKKLPMMSQSGKYNYYKGKDFQAVSLPYGSGRMSMYVFLPDKSTSLDQFERNLTAANWETWMKSFRVAPGELMLPRFRIEYEVNLNDALKALGMSEAFDSTRANFSGIAQGGIYISEVKHKTIAEVNEEGTVAAAVTSVGIQVASVQPPQENFIMKVDRPFFVAIRDNVTGTVVFMGSIADPAAITN